MSTGPDGPACVVFRVDASAQIGTGHLSRCATLGRGLQARGVRVHFLGRFEDFDPTPELAGFTEVCSPLDPTLRGEAEAAHTADYCRSVGASHAIVDHYHADEPYQLVLMRSGLRWLQFDGAAKWPLWADWIVSMSPAADSERYCSLQRRPQSRLLLGPEYAVLRDEFLQLRTTRAIKPRVQRLLLSFGGGEDFGANLLCLEALRTCDRRPDIDLAIGRTNPSRQAIEDWIKKHGNGRVELHVDTLRMAELMTRCDLAILAGGMTSFEAAGLGLPAMLISIAENQRSNAKAWDLMGVAVYLGEASTLNPQELARKISAMCDNPERRNALAQAGMEAVDCCGAKRIVDVFAE